MMLLTGQPVWQNGMPQSMQRARLRAHFFFRERLVHLEIIVARAPRQDAASGISRVYSLKPVTLPTDHLPCACIVSGLRREHARGDRAEFPARACIRAGKP